MFVFDCVIFSSCVLRWLRITAFTRCVKIPEDFVRRSVILVKNSWNRSIREVPTDYHVLPLFPQLVQEPLHPWSEVLAEAQLPVTCNWLRPNLQREKVSIVVADDWSYIYVNDYAWICVTGFSQMHGIAAERMADLEERQECYPDLSGVGFVDDESEALKAAEKERDSLNKIVQLISRYGVWYFWLCVPVWQSYLCLSFVFYTGNSKSKTFRQNIFDGLNSTELKLAYMLSIQKQCKSEIETKKLNQLIRGILLVCVLLICLFMSVSILLFSCNKTC